MLTLTVSSPCCPADTVVLGFGYYFSSIRISWITLSKISRISIIHVPDVLDVLDVPDVQSIPNLP